MIKKAALSILIVNNQLLVRMGLRQLLSLEFRGLSLGEALTSEAALAKLKERHWQIVFLDMSHQDAPEFSLMRAVHTTAPQTKMIVLAQHPESVYGARAMDLGASGYLSQGAGRATILRAVRAVLADKTHFSEATRLEADRLGKGKHHDFKFSIQEYRVLIALAEGQRPGDIAADLKISIKTVSTYKSRILNKLGARSIADLVRYVANHKLS